MIYVLSVINACLISFLIFKNPLLGEAIMIGVLSFLLGTLVQSILLFKDLDKLSKYERKYGDLEKKNES